MWRWFKIALVFGMGWASLAEGQSIELEASGGASFTESTAPALLARAGVDLWGIFTPSLRGLVVLGPHGQAVSDAVPNNQPGYQAWAIFPELRLHTPPQRVEVSGALGVGLGQLTDAQCDCSEVTVRTGKVAPYFEASAGPRVMLGNFAIGLEGVIQIFTGVTGGNSWTVSPVTPDQAAQQSPEVGLMINLSVAWMPWAA